MRLINNMTTRIQTIIFDYGAVLFDINHQLTIQAFIDLGIFNAVELFGHKQQAGLFDTFEKGLCSPEEFRAGLRAWIGKDISDVELDEAWNKMLLGIPKGKLELLNQVKAAYPTFLLSNNNQIHYDWIQDYLKREYRLDSISPYFIKDYYSHQMGMRKPDAEIFEFVLKEQGLKAEETLFIDDSPQHIRTAEALGIQTLYLTYIDLLEPELRKRVTF